MNREELDRLWDPGAPAAGAEAIVALEQRLASLRSAPMVAPLELPPRALADSADPSESSARTYSARTYSAWALAACVLVIIGACFALLAMKDSHGVPNALAPVARAPKLGPQLPSSPAAAPPGVWHVESSVGDQMCNAPGVEQAVAEGSALPEHTPFDTGDASTARLRHGEASVELHPRSQIQRVGEVLHLVYGRLWAQLPPRDHAESWVLQSRGMTVRTTDARFVWWAHERAPGEGGAPYRASDEVGIDVVSGEVLVEMDGLRTTVRAGQTCRGHIAPSMEQEARWHCVVTPAPPPAPPSSPPSSPSP